MYSSVFCFLTKILCYGLGTCAGPRDAKKVLVLAKRPPKAMHTAHYCRYGWGRLCREPLALGRCFLRWAGHSGNTSQSRDEEGSVLRQWVWLSMDFIVQETWQFTSYKFIKYLEPLLLVGVGGRKYKPSHS